MNYPDAIARLLHGKTGQASNVGMSGSSVTVFDNCVLKIEKYTDRTCKDVEAMGFLSQRLPVPRVLFHTVENGKSYLLMSRIEGSMACDEQYLRHPQVLVDALAEGLLLLQSTDTAGCPKINTVEHLLDEARDRVANGLVDIENAETNTFGEDGFRDPEQLLQWLESHRPESVLCMTHGDYCLPNIFLKDGRFSGFIDIGDMGIGEKWRDIALCWRSLRHNADGTYGHTYPDVDADNLFAKLGIEPDWTQIRWHLLLDELF